MTQQYVYKVAEVVRVTDGDTYWLRLDVGFRQLLLINVRLFGFDCPERHRGSDFEQAQAIEAARVASVFLWPGELWIRTEKDPDDFGRWLGDVWTEKGDAQQHLGDFLRERRLASLWPTRWRQEFDVS